MKIKFCLFLSLILLIHFADCGDETKEFKIEIVSNALLLEKVMLKIDVLVNQLTQGVKEDRKRDLLDLKTYLIGEVNKLIGEQIKKNRDPKNACCRAYGKRHCNVCCPYIKYPHCQDGNLYGSKDMNSDTPPEGDLYGEAVCECLDF